MRISNINNTAPYYLVVIVRDESGNKSIYQPIKMSFYSEISDSEFTGVNNSSSTFGDYDNDGDLDLLITGKNSTQTTILYRNSEGSFSEDTENTLIGVEFGSSSFGDYDNDGDLDLFITGNTGSNKISKLYQNTEGLFNEYTLSTFTGVHRGDSAFGDYDNDGDLDILIAGESDNGAFAKLYRNTEGNFTEYTGSTFTGVKLSSTLFGDIDRNGYLDIIIIGVIDNTRTIKLYKNSEGNFSEYTISTFTGTGSFPGSAVLGDYDNDGDLDLLANDGYFEVKLLENTGGIFSEYTASTLTCAKMSKVLFGDYDNDGDLDILSDCNLGSNNNSVLYRNTGGIFSEELRCDIIGVKYGSSSFGDYDNDGDLDIFITGKIDNAYVSKLYRNNVGVTNTPPSQPTGLSVEIDGENALLSWSAGSDAETISAAGLNYNLRIGSTSGASDILAPMALPLSNGYRLIPEKGMIQNLTATVNLPEGTYYWSIQAIDTAFAGSEFATEASFAIGSPEISIISNHSISEDTSIDAISFMITDTNASPCSLTITFEPSNTVLIPTENISYTCNSGYYTLTVNPELNQSGTSILTVMAINPYGNTATSSFSLTVTEVNDMPQISSIFDQSIGSANNVSITFTASDIESADCALAITITSSNQTLIPDANLSYSCNANNYTLTAIKTANHYGIAMISIMIDDGIATIEEQFTITTIPTIGFNPVAYISTENGGIISITTTLSHAIDETISADFTMIGGSASSGNDFTPNNGTIILLAGSTSKVFTLAIIDDSNYEPTENLMLSLSNFMNVTRTTGTGSSYTLTILDNDSPPTISWTPASASVSENSGSIQLTASLSMVSGLPASIDYTVSGTATNGMDYTLADGTLTIAAGSTTENITIVIGNDIIDENPETVIVQMVTYTNTSSGLSTEYTLTITDDDNPPIISFSPVTYTAIESSGVVNITAVLSLESEKEISFDYGIIGGTAVANEDYTLNANTLNILAGSTSKVFTCAILDDALDEYN